MKKLFFTCILAFFLSLGITNAQDLRLGFRTLPSLSWIHSNSEDISSGGFAGGISYGLIADKYFAENYALSTGLDVNYRGGSLEKAGNTSSYSLQFIEIPLTLKLKTNQVGPFRYFGQMGLGIDIKIHSNFDVNPLGFALIVGGGVEIPFSGKTSFVAGLLFHNGLSDLIPGDGNANGNYLALNLGILF